MPTLRQSHRSLVLLGCLVWAALSMPFAQAARPGECPQPRSTVQAPDEYYALSMPTASTNANPQSAKPVFEGNADSVNCAICHGKKGDGRGALAAQYDPPPRNFACAKTINGVPDGQLFWIIRFGSPGTAMPPHKALKDEQVWQLILYLRQLAA